MKNGIPNQEGRFGGVNPTDLGLHEYLIPVDNILNSLSEAKQLNFQYRWGTKASINIGRLAVDVIQPLREFDGLDKEELVLARRASYDQQPILLHSETPIMQISQYDRSPVEERLPVRMLQRLHMQFHIYNKHPSRKGTPYLNLQHRHYGFPSQGYRCDDFNQGVSSFQQIGETSIEQASTVIGIGDLIRNLIDESVLEIEVASLNADK